VSITKTFDSTVKETPKQKAQEIFRDAVFIAIDYWTENTDNVVGMTDREKALVQDQMGKIARRLYKML